MTVREMALRLLDEYEASEKYVNLSLSSHLADGFDRAERAALTALLYTAVERKLTYDYMISNFASRSADKLDIHTLNILRLGMCQILHMDSIPDFAAVNETVKLGRNRGERSLVNGVLRAAVRAKEEGRLPLPERKKSAARYLSVAYSFPLPLVRHFISLFGEEDTERLLGVYNSVSHTDLTVNLAKVTREEYLTTLKERGITAAPSPYSRLSVRVEGSVDPKTLPGFEQGYFLVQDAASAVSAEALGTRVGDRVIDVCACPGGKSFAAAILAGMDGSVLSLDLHESKLSLIEAGKARLGLNNITVEACDATEPKDELFGSFDRVICDCPCSGLGVLGKKSDMRYRDLGTLGELSELQYKILSASSGYVKDGGVIVYSTCTLNPEENEEVVSRFLGSHPDFVLTDFEVGELSSEGGMLTLLPHVHGTDGFFIAKLTKRGS